VDRHDVGRRSERQLAQVGQPDLQLVTSPEPSR
jgi:hypothetical protein